MPNLFVYCYGYGSSPKSDKVDRIRAKFPKDQVVAFTADVDPRIAVKYVSDSILDVLLNSPNDPGKLIIIGTSLGGWLASELADQFAATAILLNPASDPAKTLARYGVKEDILNVYTPISLKNLDRKRFYIDPDDEVIDHTELLQTLPEENVILSPGATHRFDGEEFEDMLINIL